MLGVDPLSPPSPPADEHDEDVASEVPSFLQEALQHLVEDDPSLLDGFSIIDSALLEGQNTRTLWMEANHRAAEEAAAASARSRQRFFGALRIQCQWRVRIGKAERARRARAILALQASARVLQARARAGKLRKCQREAACLLQHRTRQRALLQLNKVRARDAVKIQRLYREYASKVLHSPHVTKTKLKAVNLRAGRAKDQVSDVKVGMLVAFVLCGMSNLCASSMQPAVPSIHAGSCIHMAKTNSTCTCGDAHAMNATNLSSVPLGPGQSCFDLQASLEALEKEQASQHEKGLEHYVEHLKALERIQALDRENERFRQANANFMTANEMLRETNEKLRETYELREREFTAREKRLDEVQRQLAARQRSLERASTDGRQRPGTHAMPRTSDYFADFRHLQDYVARRLSIS